MRLGFHISIAGGFKKVVARAKERRCMTIQLFSRNPRGWMYKPLDKEDIALFRKEIENEDISPIFVHMPYLPNLASSNPDLFRRSVAALIEDLQRSAFIGARYLISHIGSSDDEEKGIEQMVLAINQAFRKVKNNVMLLLENTAGSGHELGYTFDHIGKIIKGVSENKRIGVALDTAHAFEAGYDLKTAKGVEQTINEFHAIIGLDKLHLIHLNDSKTKCGTRRDRHWHIGQGEIGNGLRYILQHPALTKLPYIMETPRMDIKEDLMNLAAAEKLLRTTGKNSPLDHD